MGTGWQSRVFDSVEVSARDCSVEVAQTLDHPAPSFTSVVELHLQALDAALLTDRPAILAEQLMWERVRLATIAPHIDPRDLHAGCVKVLARRLGRDAIEAIESVHTRAEQAVAGLRHPATKPLDPRVHAYLTQVLAGDRRGALEFVMRTADDADDVTEVLLDLLQPAQWAIGAAWEQGNVTIAQEHFATAVTQQALAMLYPRLFAARRADRRMVAVAVGAVAHEVGLRIVTDVLEHNGWQTTYLGSGVPARDVIERLIALEADIVAISASMPGELEALRDLVTAIKADPRCHRVHIVVGGRLIAMAPELADWIGADAWAADARDVTRVCERLMESGSARV